MRKKIKRHDEFYVYIVECQDGTFYTGYTNDLENRIKEHNGQVRGAKYLRGRRPVRLVWCKEYRYYKPAFLEEKRIKSLTRKQKQKLISEPRTCMSNT
jgi:putative endonuclease